MKIFEIISEGPTVTTDPATVDRIKGLWDQGKQQREIAAALGMTVNSVDHILRKYYPDRKGKIVSTTRALTDEDRDRIVKLFLSGASLSQIEKEYGYNQAATVHYLIRKLIGDEEFYRVMSLRRAEPDGLVNFKVTPEIGAKIVNLYTNGYQLPEIVDKIGSLVKKTAVWRHLRKQPNYEELKDQHLAARLKTSSNPALTKRHNNKPLSKGIHAVRRTGPPDSRGL